MTLSQGIDVDISSGALTMPKRNSLPVPIPDSNRCQKSDSTPNIETIIEPIPNTIPSAVTPDDAKTESVTDTHA